MLSWFLMKTETAKKLKNMAYLMPTILCMTAIFLFSMAPGEDSARQSGLFVRAISELISDVSKRSVSPETFGALQLIVRKIAHLTEYAALGASCSFYMIHAREINKKRTVFFIATFISFIYAITDEIHQYFVPGRYGTFSDVLIDTCGALIGISVYFLLRRKR